MQLYVSTDLPGWFSSNTFTLDNDIDDTKDTKILR